MKFFLFALLMFWASGAFAQVVNADTVIVDKPFILGVVHQLRSAELSEIRTLNVYLPEGYDANDTTRYPVVYLLDGSAGEDFIHTVGTYQFNSFPWVNRVPPSIVVGIANIDRKRDFTFPTTIDDEKKKYPTTGQSNRFINFIEKELQPYIASKYKTTDAKTLIGESLGGLLASEILLKRPTLFTTYIIVSPSLWWDNGSLLNVETDLLKDSLKRKTSVYIGVGKEGLTPGKNSRVMEVDANVLADKLKNSGNKNLTVLFDYLPQENHGTIANQAVYNALRLLSSGEGLK